MSQSGSPDALGMSGAATTPEVEEGGFLEAKAELDAIIDTGVEDTTIDNMTEPLGKGSHGHGPVKGQGEGAHDVRGAFNVNPSLVTEEFEPGTLPNGHEALAYMVANREALINADPDVFLDVADDHAGRWDRIKSVRRSAPISPRRESEIFSDAR